ncbi:hypothetical protein M3Y95_00919500 [Aphelenchoides besseyi]|nr:hypothetical protein M3Y95_00919500 [Aphelenchoides besseyi]
MTHLTSAAAPFNGKLNDQSDDLPVNSNIDLQHQWGRPDVTTERVIRLLLEHDDRFATARGQSMISRIEGKLISEGRAFLSKVFKICVYFNSQTKSDGKIQEINNSCHAIDYSFVLKVTQHRNWKNYADEKMEGSIQTMLEEEKVEGEHDDELLSVAASYHNSECEFYRLFSDGIFGTPLPEVYYIEPIDHEHDGLLIMEDLTVCGDTLGYYGSATVEQVYAIAKAAAHLHVHCDDEKLRKWWSTKFGHVFLDLFVDEFQPTGFPMLQKHKEIVDLLDGVKATFSREFCYEALVNRAREYNAIAMIHSDLQPNNIIWRKDENGGLTNELAAIIDWQLCFGGNPFCDLARFIICSVDKEVREVAEAKAFDLYYSEVSRLYKERGGHVPYNLEQARELYDLAVAQMTGSMIILMAFVENRKTDKTADIFVKRIADGTAKAAEIIKQRQWDHYGKDVDWKAMMYKK